MSRSLGRTGGWDAAGTLHLSWENLDAPSIPHEALEATLDSTELARARRLRDPRLRSRWVASRGLLRHLLAVKRGCDPVDVPIRTSSRGKPYLADHASSFNLSHSGAHLLVALSSSGRVGVDVEVLRPVADLEGLTRRFFAPSEVEAIVALPDEGPRGGRLLAFFRAWVRKEAFLKGIGSGVTAPLDAFEVEVGAGADEAPREVPPREREAPSRGRSEAGTGRHGLREPDGNLLLHNGLPGELGRPWQIRSVSAPAGAVAAVAWDVPELIPCPGPRPWPSTTGSVG